MDSSETHITMVVGRIVPFLFSRLHWWWKIWWYEKLLGTFRIRYFSYYYSFTVEKLYFDMKSFSCILCEHLLEIKTFSLFGTYPPVISLHGTVLLVTYWHVIRIYIQFRAKFFTPNSISFHYLSRQLSYFYFLNCSLHLQVNAVNSEWTRAKRCIASRTSKHLIRWWLRKMSLAAATHYIILYFLFINM